MNVSFQELLLQKIARNDPPKTKKKRVSKGAEVLTYKEVTDRMEREHEENKREAEMKEVRKKIKMENSINKKKGEKRKAKKTQFIPKRNLKKKYGEEKGNDIRNG